MSKIQKALEALQSAKRNVGDPNSVGGAETSSISEAGRYKVRKGTGGTKESRSKVFFPDDDIAEEIEPNEKIAVDLDRLVAMGLFPSAEHAEMISHQFRRIKRPLLQSAFEIGLPVGENANTIMMASALPGSGKSFCSVNLAHSISLERDVGAVLVDSDVLKPGTSRAFGLDDRIGLIDYLLDPAIAIQDILVETDLNGINFIPAGRKHPEATELLASRRMQKLLKQLSDGFRHRVVIFDTPPLLVTNEARVLAEKVGQIVLVIEAHVSLQEQVIRALALLDRQKPINAILNKSHSAQGGHIYADDYGYYPYQERGDS
ncbi:MAG: hypothetical protein OEW73_00435 [Gammaproteobacteria bacterium]|nr:hypothetical protein [Gammaproteobacteria bacterium]MDH5239228.1 hypothetical protein [Gammaproteobacteria bacterium]MDH5259907.1 hypothetical protein [Gammaproteobacteria bacterium]